MGEDVDLERYAARRGDVIANNYVVGNLLGIGGMGIVYAAVQRSLDRVVALKVPRPELANDPRVRERLRLEALASSRIAHRNSVRVFDFGSHSGAPYLVMEHVAGPRLGQLLVEHGPLPIGVAVRLIRQVASVLEEAHVNGIVHADVKCDNILVETLRDGSLQPRVIDWGIARFSDRRDYIDPSLVTGTPEYLAPEVAMGGRPTFAADVYAIGVMLYELVSGATPFAGSAQVMVSKLEEVVAPLSTRCPTLEISTALDAVVSRALSRDPGSRFPDAGAFGRALALVPTPSPTEHLEVQTNSIPLIFSTEAPTATMAVVQALAAKSPVARSRAALVSALQAGDTDAIIVAYLELARTLVDDHRIDQAILELERAVELLSESPSTSPVWRLLLTLAALYDGNGDRNRARVAARLAREVANRVGSNLGCERAEQLSARLARSSAAPANRRDR